MAKLAAFALFACAAFAWVPPWLDRAGTAALALAFMAWSVGPPLLRWRPRPQVAAAPALLDHPERIEPVSAYLEELLGAEDGR